MYTVGTVKGRIQAFKQGGSNTVMHTKRAQKFLSHTYFPETTPICMRFHGLQISRSQPIDTKVSESMSLLASILVFEGFLLV